MRPCLLMWVHCAVGRRAMNTYSRLLSVNGFAGEPAVQGFRFKAGDVEEPEPSFFVAHHSELVAPSSRVMSIRLSPDE